MGRIRRWGAAVTRFAYDGTDLIAEYDGAGTLLRRYVHGPGSDEPLVWYEGSSLTNRRWYHADERGSVIATSDAAGAAIAINSYDDHGIPALANQGRFGYTGQTFLGDLGMNYYKARMYSPTMGRFMQTDPIGYGDGLNMYAYVGGDPVNKVDPSGLCDEGTKGSMPCSYSQRFGLDTGDIVVTGKRYVPDLTTNERIRITELSLTLGRVSAFNSYSQAPDGAGQQNNAGNNKPQSRRRKNLQAECEASGGVYRGRPGCVSKEYADWQDDQFKAIVQCGVGLGMSIIGAPEAIAGATLTRAGAALGGGMTIWGCADVAKKAPSR